MKLLLRFLIIGLAAWGILRGLTVFLHVDDSLPLWASAALIALGSEIVIGIYRYESKAVKPRQARTLLGLRLAALALLCWILLEPAWVRTVLHTQDRELVLIFDESASMQLIDDGSGASRIELARSALEQAGLVKNLAQQLRVRPMRLARSLRADPESSGSPENPTSPDPVGWDQATDLAAGLASVLEQVPPDQLAGAILVSDGRHNRPARVEEAARRFGILDAPVGVLAIGSAEPPRDASILSVEAPEAIHLGDRMRIRAKLKFDGYQGETAQVSLISGEEILETKEVAVPDQHHRSQVDFAQIPEAGGVSDFKLVISPLAGERFTENNQWSFETSITDARTNVLLIDRNPRWEFRYLRNLFYGRDKSVHLQWLLMNPDRLEGIDAPHIEAAADRPFGEAQATALPANESEWRKFDVIILGDLEANALDPATWEIISRCVNQRGAMLVMIAGPESMPHAITAPTGRALVPVDPGWGSHTHFKTDDKPFRFALANAGEGHPVTRQEISGVPDHEVWNGFPELRWRHPVIKLADGAEVLLTAAANDAPPPAPLTNLDAALNELATRRQREAENALLVVRQTGNGKVALLLTDRTWRLRVGSGDLYHHRFWGNLVRWGAGPVLRSGGNLARLGTEQLNSTPDDRVRIQARLRDASFAPVFDRSLQAKVFHRGKLIATLPLAPRMESNGLHEAMAGPFSATGAYEVRISGTEADRLIAQDGAEELATSFNIVASNGPLELGETTLNLQTLQEIASLSGGRVFATADVAGLADLFTRPAREREEVRETTLWDHWSVLGLLFVCLTSEWVLRRNSGLP